MAQLNLIYGASGARKTTAIGTAVPYLYERAGGKPGRAVYSDGGGYQVIKGVVEAGFLEPYNIQDEPNIPLLLHKIARGYWPEKLENGLRVKGTKLAPPNAETWKKVGFYVYEGLTSSAELEMKYLRDTQQAIGGEAVGKFNIVNDFTTDADSKPALFCANNMKHYDWVQGEMITLLGEFAGLPVERVLISAHETAGTDDDTRDPIRGPALVGKAGTAKIGKNVGDSIHFEIYTKPVGTVLQTDVKCYYVSHPDPKFPNVFYNAKSRVPAEMVPEMLKTFPGGTFTPDKFGEYLKTCDSLIATSGQGMVKLRTEIDTRLGK